jgi:hypothetical protein
MISLKQNLLRIPNEDVLPNYVLEIYPLRCLVYPNRKTEVSPDLHQRLRAWST